MSILIGSVPVRNRVLLAPMSGVSDAPFRTLAHAWGAGLVVSEMVASEELARSRADVLRRAAGAGRVSPLVIQLAGREPHWMAEGACIARDLGADVIDINMGCPARQVTGGWSGSALMRNLDHAETLIEATVKAVAVPVTVKMRLGWDDANRNAPELARRAEAVGARAITVHGRTRCQFYKGSADWKAISAVRAATSLPLVANGDCRSLADVKAMLDASGADAAMVGRGGYGRPWLPGLLAEALEQGTGRTAPTPAERRSLILAHYRDMLDFYGEGLGLRVARKHVGWYLETAVEDGLMDRTGAGEWRARLCRDENPQAVLDGLAEVFDPGAWPLRDAA
ncbi:MAG: tRNA dihydrouridine synthase DusB [Parvibaculaceae bacterium]